MESNTDECTTRESICVTISDDTSNEKIPHKIHELDYSALEQSCENTSIDGDVSVLNNSKKKSSIETLCGGCDREATKGRGSLKSTNCTKRIHFECTNLPPYMIFTLSSTKRQYTCEKCAEPPEDFLRSIINRNIVATNHVLTHDNKTQENSLESKITEIHEYIEKYDLHNIAHQIQEALNKMYTVNNKIMENVSKWEKKVVRLC